VDGLGHPADLRDRAGEGRQVPGVAAQGAHELAAGGVVLQQAAGDAQEVVVLLGDQRGVEAVAGELVESAAGSSRQNLAPPASRRRGANW
jgi:hypothetical protein